MLVLVLSSWPLLPPQAYAVSSPDLSIGKHHFGGFYVNSPLAAYNFYVPNGASGGPTTGPITLTDTLPTGITYNSILSSSDWGCSTVGQMLTCTSPGQIFPGNSTSLSIKVDVSAAAVGQRSNTATVSTQGDTNAANNTSSPDVVVVTATPGPPDLLILKSHSGEFRVGSANARYSFAVRNQNGGPTTGTITLTDTLPLGITFTAIYTQSGGWSCAAAGQLLTCTNPGPLATGGSSQLRIDVNLAAAAVGQRTNTATISTAGDTDPANNTSPVDTVTVTATVSPPDLTVIKNHAGLFVVGSADAEYIFRYLLNPAGRRVTRSCEDAH